MVSAEFDSRGDSTSRHSTTRAQESRSKAAHRSSWILGLIPSPLQFAVFDCPQFFRLNQRGQIFDFPNVLGKSGLHGWRNPQRLVDTAEIVVHEMQGDVVGVILDLL